MRLTKGKKKAWFIWESESYLVPLKLDLGGTPPPGRRIQRFMFATAISLRISGEQRFIEFVYLNAKELLYNDNIHLECLL